LTTSGLLAPLRERDFARLWAGQIVSNSGDWVNYVALTSLVWHLTGSAWMLAALRACHAVPFLLLSPFSGVLVDRWNRRTTLIVVDLLRAGLVLLFPLVHDVTAILLITLAFNIVSTFYAPAKNALIPRVVSQDRLLSANSLSSTTSNMAMILGPALGGILLAASGTTAAFLFDSTTFLFSVAAVASMSVSGSIKRKAAATRPSAWQDLSEGFRFVASRSAVRAVLLMELALAAGWGSVNVIAVVIAEKVLGGGSAEYGLLLTATGVGALGGALFAGAKGQQLGIWRLFPLGFTLLGSAIALLAGSSVLFAALIAFFFMGTGRIVIDVASVTTYQKAVPDALLGRVFALRHMVTHVAILTFNQLAGFFTDAASVTPILAAAAAIQLVFVPLSLLFLAKPRALDPDSS